MKDILWDNKGRLLKPCQKCREKTARIRKMNRRLRKLLERIRHRTCLYETAENKGPENHERVTREWREVRDYLTRILEGDEDI